MNALQLGTTNLRQPLLSSSQPITPKRTGIQGLPPQADRSNNPTDQFFVPSLYHNSLFIEQQIEGLFARRLDRFLQKIFPFLFSLPLLARRLLTPEEQRLSIFFELVRHSKLIRKEVLNAKAGEASIDTVSKILTLPQICAVSPGLSPPEPEGFCPSATLDTNGFYCPALLNPRSPAQLVFLYLHESRSTSVWYFHCITISGSLTNERGIRFTASVHSEGWECIRKYRENSITKGHFKPWPLPLPPTSQQLSADQIDESINSMFPSAPHESWSNPFRMRTCKPYFPFDRNFPKVILDGSDMPMGVIHKNLPRRRHQLPPSPVLPATAISFAGLASLAPILYQNETLRIIQTLIQASPVFQRDILQHERDYFGLPLIDFAFAKTVFPDHSEINERLTLGDIRNADLTPPEDLVFQDSSPDPTEPPRIRRIACRTHNEFQISFVFLAYYHLSGTVYRRMNPGHIAKERYKCFSICGKTTSEGVLYQLSYVVRSELNFERNAGEPEREEPIQYYSHRFDWCTAEAINSLLLKHLTKADFWYTDCLDYGPLSPLKAGPASGAASASATGGPAPNSAPRPPLMRDLPIPFVSSATATATPAPTTDRASGFGTPPPAPTASATVATATPTPIRASGLSTLGLPPAPAPSAPAPMSSAAAGGPALVPLKMGPFSKNLV